MDAKEFIALLNHPEKVEEHSVEELKELSLKYPYSQPVQLLYAIRLSRSSEYLFNRQLGKTSILTDDRSVLFDFFERPNDSATEYPPQEYVEEEISAPEEEAQVPTEVDGQEELVEELPAETEEAEEEAATEQQEKEAVEYLPLKVVDREEDNQNEGEETPPGPAEEVAAEKDVEQESLNKEEPTPEASQAPLNAKDRIKAILEENRRLRGEFKSARKEEKKELSGIEQRLEEIKKRLEVNRQNKQEATPSDKTAKEAPAGDAPEEKLQREVERKVEEIKQQVETEPEATEMEIAPEPLVKEEADVSEQDPATPEPDEEVAIRPELPTETPELLPEAGDTEQTQAEDKEPETAKTQVSAKGHEAPSAKETHSFSEWIKLLKKKPTDEPEPAQPEPAAPSEEAEPAKTGNFEKKIELLDTFVEKLPELKKKKVAAPKTEKFPSALHNVHGSSDDSLVTETLARVYIEQKHYEKAIKAYEIMKLKYPEKSGLFAARISEIKKLINSK